MKTAFQDLLSDSEKPEEYLIFSANIPENVFPRFRRFIKRLHFERVRKRIPSKILVSEKLRKTLGKDRRKEKLIKVKFVPIQLAGPAVINVYKEKTLIAIWSEEPSALLLESKMAADSFKNYFELLWETAKR